MKAYLKIYNHAKYFWPNLSQFLTRLSFFINLRCDFRVSKAKSRNLYYLQIWYKQTIPVNSPDFEDFSQSPDLNKKSPDLGQDFLYLKINQFFEKLINFVRESFFFLKVKEYTSTPVSTDFIFFKSFALKIKV